METIKIWSGRGVIQEGEAYWELAQGRHKGMMVGRNYVRERISNELLRWSKYYSLEARRKVLNATANNDKWLWRRNGNVVSDLCRQAVSMLLAEPGDLKPHATSTTHSN